MTPTTFRRPAVLAPGREDEAARHLRRYVDVSTAGTPSGFTGAFFDGWDPDGRRAEDADRFTADDLVAVTFLSVEIPPRAAQQLLVEQRGALSRLLAEVVERDLVDVEEPLTPSSPEWQLNDALRTIDGIGPTTASKLMARKRPRLLPIYDSVIDQHVLSGSGVLWEPLRQALRADGRALHEQLVALRVRAGVGDSISAIRVVDILAWMEGKGYIPAS
ncbi:DUF6308 family protein [Phycicoccus duodecadis]|uniref:Uncharacterized protein n=1 Tax=Phycicoccus duodecadis TaxID=173053 RepID=A0A2N3YFU5_9MICO|nr:DUF6308 family protein [Phycicoccus duodecadis]PKW25721.1 hypothetical protein ATL31_0520 [Phycicoccus duodecadis]